MSIGLQIVIQVACMVAIFWNGYRIGVMRGRMRLSDRLVTTFNSLPWAQRDTSREGYIMALDVVLDEMSEKPALKRSE